MSATELDALVEAMDLSDDNVRRGLELVADRARDLQDWEGTGDPDAPAGPSLARMRAAVERTLVTYRALLAESGGGAGASNQEQWVAEFEVQAAVLDALAAEPRLSRGDLYGALAVWEMQTGE